MQQYDHLPVAGLEECVLDVVVEDVDFVPPDGGVPKTVHVGLKHSGQALLHDVWPDVQVLQRKRCKKLVMEVQKALFLTFSLGCPLPWLVMRVSCLTRSAFSFSSASRVLNFFWMSLISLEREEVDHDEASRKSSGFYR